MNRKTKNELLLLAGLSILLIIVVKNGVEEIKRIHDLHKPPPESGYINIDPNVFDTTYAIPPEPYLSEDEIISIAREFLIAEKLKFYENMTAKQRVRFPPLEYDPFYVRERYEEQIHDTKLSYFVIPLEGRSVKMYLYQVNNGLYFDPKTGELKARSGPKDLFKKRLP